MQAIREENNNQGGRATISRQTMVFDMDGLALKQLTNKAGRLLDCISIFFTFNIMFCLKFYVTILIIKVLTYYWIF